MSDCDTVNTAGTLDAIVDQYELEIAPRRREALARFKAMPDLQTVIHHAAMAIGPDGKMERHQRRVGEERLRLFEAALQAKRSQIARAKSFEELYALVWSNRFPRVGRLATYDTSIRIGVFLGLTPEVVYVHCGAANGACELGLLIVRGRVELRHLPEPLRRLSPDEVEDCLFIYKGRFDSHATPRRLQNGSCGSSTVSRGC